MGIYPGFKYLENMAIYSTKSFVENYGKDLEKKYDEADKIKYRMRIFCLDCENFKVCKGRLWKGCRERAEALKIIRGE